MKNISITLLFFIKIILLSLFETKTAETQNINSIDLNKNNPSITFDIRKKCNSECNKLSKIYPCFCDLSCTEYGDCCKLFAKGCENYFFDLISEIKLINVSNLKNNSNETTTYERGGKNYSFNMHNHLSYNITVNESNKISYIKYDHNGRCCHDKVEPFNCFCDSMCVKSGDCCVDYNYCLNKKLINDTMEKVSLRKRNLHRSFRSKNYINNNFTNLKKNLKTYNENVISFRNLKNVIYEKLGLLNNNNIEENKLIKQNSQQKNFSSVDCIITNNTNPKNTDYQNKNPIGFANISTLTPQLDMKYIFNSFEFNTVQIKEDEIKNNMKGNYHIKQFQPKLKRNNNKIFKYDESVIKISPAIINIKKHQSLLE